MHRLSWHIIWHVLCSLPHDLYYVPVACRTSLHHMSAHMSTLCMLRSGWNRLYCFRASVIVPNFCLFLCKVSSLTAFELLQENNPISSGIWSWGTCMSSKRIVSNEKVIEGRDTSNYASIHSVHGLQCSKKLINWCIRLVQTFLYYLYGRCIP